MYVIYFHTSSFTQIVFSFNRVEKITQKEVVFTTDADLIVFDVHCWMVKDKTKTNHPITKVDSKKIDKKAWVRCQVDIKSGYDYEFVFKSDKVRDSTCFVSLQGNTLKVFKDSPVDNRARCVFPNNFTALIIVYFYYLPCRQYKFLLDVANKAKIYIVYMANSKNTLLSEL